MNAHNNNNIKPLKVGEHVIGWVPSPDPKKKGTIISGFVTATTSLGVYVTDGAKSKYDQFKVEASEWFNSDVCNIRRA